MFTDGYWVIVCEQIKEAKTVDDLVYFTRLDHSQQVYSRIKNDDKVRN